jgi:trans-aconitate methyltransferase
VAEYRLFEGAVPDVSTFEFHEHRERAPHLEQEGHRPRLLKAQEYVCSVLDEECTHTVSDLGCGDGGLLSLLKDECECWGYDFQPSNRDGWKERGVSAVALDAFGRDWSFVKFGSVVVTTEVLEHLADPHGTVRWIQRNCQWLVASSPAFETAQNHDPCHAWAWDMEGYRNLFLQAGFKVHRQELVQPGFQVVLAGNR